MNIIRMAFLTFFLLPYSLWADDAFFCPQNHGYIKIGMSPQEVMAACGQPVAKEESNKPVLQKIPVTQLMFNNKGTDSAFYGVWNIPTGSGGTSLQVDIVDKKVKSVKVNNQDSNAFSICQGTSIQVGDPVGKVYNNCGSPTLVNSTFINQVVPTAKKPEVWIYELSPYQPPVSLTFVNGKLQSINQ